MEKSLSQSHTTPLPREGQGGGVAASTPLPHRDGQGGGVAASTPLPHRDGQGGGSDGVGGSVRSLIVSALDHGTVIDHIPCDRLFEVINLLHLQEMTSKVTIGYNLKSHKMGTKSIIKIADRFFTDEELNQLSVVAPNVSLSIIRDYEVVEKKQVCLPEDLHGIVRCDNPKCITNNEPMSAFFHVTDKQKGIIRCHYCNHEQNLRK